MPTLPTPSGAISNADRTEDGSNASAGQASSSAQSQIDVKASSEPPVSKKFALPLPLYPIPIPVSANDRPSNVETAQRAPIMHEGWVEIKGAGIVLPWKSRYLCLRQDVIFVHRSERDKPISLITLDNVVHVGRAEESGFIFTIKKYTQAAGGNSTEIIKFRVGSDNAVYEWVDFIYAASPRMGGIGVPSGFYHDTHVSYDAKRRLYVGLPQRWAKIMGAQASKENDP
jgi:serine/threonine-protein kinase CLA4